MYKKLGILFLLLISLASLKAQELNCQVKVVSPSIQRTDKQIFTSLQNSIFQFMNNRKWTDQKINSKERINCNIIIEITAVPSIDRFKATVQLQSTRPVYGASYNSILFNHKDEAWDFNYQEFQAIEFDLNGSNEQLPSLLAYYAYLILGLDFDTYSKNGGTTYFNNALKVLNSNQGKLGWNRNDGKSNKNKYSIINNILNDRFKVLRTLMYNYHRKGMDKMYKDVTKSRKIITEEIEGLQDLSRSLPNAAFLKLFFNAKVNELVEIYKGGTAAEKAKIITLLTKLDPANSSVYQEINKK